MKKLNLIGLISQSALAAVALLCLILSAINGYVALIVISALVMIAVLYLAGSYVANHFAPELNYFAGPIWFWNVFCKDWVWNVFCKEWIWGVFCLIFCKKWVWEIFCKSWVWETFCKNWVFDTFLKKWTWNKFCKEWIWSAFCVKFMWRTVHLDVACAKFNDWVIKTFIVKWVWNKFCKEWIWKAFCVKFMWRTVHLDIACAKLNQWVIMTFFVKWIWKGFFVKIVWNKLHVRILYDKFDKWKAWLYLSPALVLLLIFTIWPIFNTFKMAFTVYWDPAAPNYVYDENGEQVKVIDEETKAEIPAVNGYGAYRGYTVTKDIGNEEAKKQGRTDQIVDFEFGFSNFTAVVGTRDFGTIMKNTLILCIATVPLSTFLALLIAVCLNAIKPLRRFLQTIFFLPYVTNSIAIGMVFSAMFNIVQLNEKNILASKSLGVINSMLQLFGMQPQNWVNQGSPYWANIAVMIIYIVWNALPFKILILLGGLQSVNKQYYEAAKIDATPRWRVFTRVTIPLLSPMITYVVITGFIGGFKEYSSIVGIFGDDMAPPGSQTRVLDTMVGYIYECLGEGKLGEGVASAAALILFAIIFVVTLINLYVSKKSTHY